MRTGLRTATAVLLALVVAAGSGGPVVGARGKVVPTLHPVITDITCNPGGEPGLSASAEGSVQNGTIRGASLYVGEFQVVNDPAYAPFPWNAMTLANWGSDDTWRRGVSSDARTLVTADAHTWNWRNHATGLWTRSEAGSWWIVDYSISSGSTNAASRWYVHCADGSRVDAATLREIDFTDEEGLR